MHEKLSEDHFQLNPSSRMRNSLAEDVLDRKMLILMKVNLFLYCTLKRFIFKPSDKFTVTSQSDLLFILYVTFAGNLQKYLFRPTKIISRLWVIWHRKDWVLQYNFFDIRVLLWSYFPTNKSFMM
jgi:hypothetical protein